MKNRIIGGKNKNEDGAWAIQIKNEEALWELWDLIIKTNIKIIGNREGEERKKWGENLFF